MKLFGYWFSDTALARKISPAEDGTGAIFVPQDRTVMFRKLPYKTPGQPEHPRRCVFEVEGWLESKAEFKTFREAVLGKDYF